MGTRHTIEPLQSKISELDQDPSSAQGFLYNCGLCDQALVLSKLFINPRKVQLAFSNTCPECGFVNPLGYCWNSAKDTPEQKEARAIW